ncbi:hypothetical protein TNCV_3852311 [Trichonephila clavipes]|nr:hypothetical protein TNCV_3852311 [Trichonephila clavipes]
MADKHLKKQQPLSGARTIDEDSNHLRREKEREAILRKKEKSVVCEERAELVYERIRRRTQFINTAASAASTEEMKRLDQCFSNYQCLEDLMKHMGYSEFGSSLRSIENFPGNRYIIKQREKNNSRPLNKQKRANAIPITECRLQRYLQVKWRTISEMVWKILERQILSKELLMESGLIKETFNCVRCKEPCSIVKQKNHQMEVFGDVKGRAEKSIRGTKTCDIERKSGFSSATLADWRHFVHEQVLDHVELTSSKIGGVLVPHSGNCAVIIIAQANGFTTFGFFSIWKRASLELPPPLIMNPVKFCFGENEIFETRCFLGNPKKNIIRSPLPTNPVKLFGEETRFLKHVVSSANWMLTLFVNTVFGVVWRPWRPLQLRQVGWVGDTKAVPLATSLHTTPQCHRLKSAPERFLSTKS